MSLTGSLAAGVSEPILYRHFGSKRELYLACLQAAWDGFRAALDAKLEDRGDRDVVTAIGEGAPIGFAVI